MDPAVGSVVGLAIRGDIVRREEQRHDGRTMKGFAPFRNTELDCEYGVFFSQLYQLRYVNIRFVKLIAGERHVLDGVHDIICF